MFVRVSEGMGVWLSGRASEYCVGCLSELYSLDMPAFYAAKRRMNLTIWIGPESASRTMSEAHYSPCPTHGVWRVAFRLQQTHRWDFGLGSSALFSFQKRAAGRGLGEGEVMCLGHFRDVHMTEAA